jgi:hypothetical protein
VPKFKVTGTRVEYYSCCTVVEAVSAVQAQRWAEDGETDLFHADNCTCTTAHEDVVSVEAVK